MTPAPVEAARNTKTVTGRSHQNKNTMVKQGVIWIGLMIFSLSGHAQQRGKVEVVVDPLISLMQRNRMGTSISTTSANKPPIDKNNATRTTAMGFRVQIYSGSNRSDAYAEQARFKSLYQGIDTYVSYDEPNYRVKVGDFRSRSEAQDLMQGLRKEFNNVFIFTEEIYIYQ